MAETLRRTPIQGQLGYVHKSAIAIEEMENRRLIDSPVVNNPVETRRETPTENSGSNSGNIKNDTYYKHEDNPEINHSLTEK